MFLHNSDSKENQEGDKLMVQRKDAVPVMQKGKEQEEKREERLPWGSVVRRPLPSAPGAGSSLLNLDCWALKMSLRHHPHSLYMRVRQGTEFGGIELLPHGAIPCLP